MALTTIREGGRSGILLEHRNYFEKAIAGVTNIDDPVMGYISRQRETHIATPVWSIPLFNKGKLTATQAAIRTRSLAHLHLGANPARNHIL